MKIAIVGCGFIGHKRAKYLGQHQLTVTADAVQSRAEALAAQYPGARAAASWQEAVADPNVDVVFVSTTHKFLPEITLAAVKAGKHVLVDKPAATRAAQLDPIIEIARRDNRKVKIGFNHRHHPAIKKALHMVKEGLVGELMFIRARYGHGGRVGYEKEWRADPELGGGGELLDQGMHLIDLSRMFLGDFETVEGHVTTYFWDMPVEDNGFLSLRTKKNQTAWLHVSWTEWKNIFSFEIYGRTGKLQIDGLGGSYGTEQLAYYKMLPAMGPPETTIWQFPGEDLSWEIEFKEFIHEIEEDCDPVPGLADARAALSIVETVYEKSKQPVGASS
jgi:predicted dehydrogenase